MEVAENPTQQKPTAGCFCGQFLEKTIFISQLFPLLTRSWKWRITCSRWFYRSISRIYDSTPQCRFLDRRVQFGKKMATRTFFSGNHSRKVDRNSKINLRNLQDRPTSSRPNSPAHPFKFQEINLLAHSRSQRLKLRFENFSSELQKKLGFLD